MYGLEKNLGVSYEGFEQGVSKLFSAIEYKCKSYKETSGSIKREIGSRGKGVRELLKLASSINYDAKRNLPKPHPY